jgi:hypothetical protein
MGWFNKNVDYIYTEEISEESDSSYGWSNKNVDYIKTEEIPG